METDGWQPGDVDVLAEPARRLLGVDGATVESAEHQVMFLPRDVGRELLLELVAPMPAEHGDRGGVEGDLASSVSGLGLVDHRATVGHGQVAVDEDRGGVEVDVAPLQAESLGGGGTDRRGARW